MAPLPPPPPRPPRLPPPPPRPAPASSGPRVVTNTYDHSVSRWGLGEVVLTLVLYIVVGTGIGLLALGGDVDSTLEGPWLPGVLTVPPMAALAYLTWLARRRGAGLTADFRLQARRQDLLVGFGLLVGAWIMAIATLLIMIALGGEAPSAAAADLAIDSGEGTGITVWILAFAVLGSTLVPLVEELLFRGLFWSALEKRGINNIVTLLITSAGFAAFHFEPSRFPILFAIGLAFGVGRLVTGRIAASILAHALVNAVSMVAIISEVA
ncbi:MAG: type II CAAX endopeptidase family protein [Acidimicrobiales bacterium]